MYCLINVVLGAFANLQKKSDYWLRHVCPSGRISTGSHWTDLH